ncbi:hypothetical protein BDZ89DRAFT_1048193 [Hymenopellis radicata]|nr:hypothetical protein BDZ89DRAFT_1048193 [Hymenopellis radicata]
MPDSTSYQALKKHLLHTLTSQQLLPSPAESEADYRHRLDPENLFGDSEWLSWQQRPEESPKAWQKRQNNAVYNFDYRKRKTPAQKQEDSRKTVERNHKRRRNMMTESVNENPPPQRTIIDLREAISFRRAEMTSFTLENKLFCVHAFLPWLDDGNHSNLLQREASLVHTLADRASGLVEDTTDDVLVLRNISPADHPTVRQALSLGRAVFIPSKPGCPIPKLTREWLQDTWGIDIDSPVREAHSMRSKADAFSPSPSANATAYKEGRISVESVLRPSGLDDDHIYVLDLPCFAASLPDSLRWQESGFLTFLFTDKDGKKTQEQIPRQQWADRLWGLLHQAMTNTTAHHDADGKVTIILGQAGYKFWFVITPAAGQAATREELEAFQKSLFDAEQAVKYPENIAVRAFLISPGSILIQPPGLMHAVYTPVPSYVNGSSFWAFETMHLTRLSRLSDVASGDVLTNVDHNDTMTYDSFLRLMCIIPSIRRDLPRNALLALISMVLFPHQYFLQHDLHPNHDEAVFRDLLRSIKPLPLRPLAVNIGCALSKSLGILNAVGNLAESHLKWGRTRRMGYKDSAVRTFNDELSAVLDAELTNPGEMISLDKYGLRETLWGFVKHLEQEILFIVHSPVGAIMHCCGAYTVGSQHGKVTSQATSLVGGGRFVALTYFNPTDRSCFRERRFLLMEARNASRSAVYLRHDRMKCVTVSGTPQCRQSGLSVVHVQKRCKDLLREQEFRLDLKGWDRVIRPDGCPPLCKDCGISQSGMQMPEAKIEKLGELNRTSR